MCNLEIISNSLKMQNNLEIIFGKDRKDYIALTNKVNNAFINYGRYLEQNGLEQNINTYQEFLKNYNPNSDWIEVKECDYVIDKLDADYLVINGIVTTNLDMLDEYIDDDYCTFKEDAKFYYNKQLDKYKVVDSLNRVWYIEIQ